MVRSHWLDPLARQVLKLSGHLPRNKKIEQSAPLKEDDIERELEAIKQKQAKVQPNGSPLVDVNRATASDWRSLPGCTESMIKLLLRLQKGGVQLSGNEDLCKLLDLSPDIAESWTPYLIFRWYGGSPPLEQAPPIDINYATPSIIKKNLNWSDDRVQRLVRERQKQLFNNLADLQERLTLPPSCVEQLIGGVRFGTKSAGPTLPPGC